MSTTTKPATIRKTANQLEVGDVILNGNIVLGFSYSLVMHIEKTKHRVLISEQFAHGGVSSGNSVGKNAIYWVVA